MHAGTKLIINIIIHVGVLGVISVQFAQLMVLFIVMELRYWVWIG